MKRLLLATMLTSLILLGCSKAEPTPSPVPAATPTATITEKRFAAVAFLRQLNTLNNNLSDTFNVNFNPRSFTTGNQLAANKALTTIKSQLAGYRGQLSELQAPNTLPELQVISFDKLVWVSNLAHTLDKMTSAISAGDAIQLNAAILDFQKIDSDSSALNERVLAVMTQYNIPDAEVGYRRQ